MQNNKHVLVLTDNEDNEIVRLLLKCRVVPITQRSILSSLDILRHVDIYAIIIDIELHSVDVIEFVLNARDITNVPIFVLDPYYKKEKWSVVEKIGEINFSKSIILLKTEIVNLFKINKNIQENK